jgi:hypothetical protein
MSHDDYYGPEMMERRERFNNIIRGMDMVLMNTIPEADPSVWENWGDKSPMGNDECERSEDGKSCIVHDKPWNDVWCTCEDYESDSEVYQWFAITSNDADFLKRHNQYVTYSDMLDTYFLAICYFGMAWDYTDSMVDDILGDREAVA